MNYELIAILFTAAVQSLLLIIAISILIAVYRLYQETTADDAALSAGREHQA